MKRFVEFSAWVTALILSGTLIYGTGNFDSDDPFAITAWILVAGVFMIAGTILVSIPVAIGLGVWDARAYYRANPDAVPPDKMLVRIGLWRCR